MAVWVIKLCLLASFNKIYAHHGYSAYGVSVNATALNLMVGSLQMHMLPNMWQNPQLH